MIYTINVLPSAYDDLDEMPARFRFRALDIINSLANDPYPPRSKQLRDPLTRYHRIPLEKWRILYEVREAIQEIAIHRVKLKTGPETYEDLEP